MKQKKLIELFFFIIILLDLNLITGLNLENFENTEKNFVCVNYQIFNKKALVEINFIAGLEDINDSLEFLIPYDARTIEVSSNINIQYNVTETKDHKLIKIYNSNLSKKLVLNISYITNSVIDKSSRNYFFILKNPFTFPVCLRVYLPEGGFLEEEGVLFPDPDSITSDGRRIVLNWNNLSSEEVVFAYNLKKSFSFWVILLSLGLFLVVVYQFILLKKRISKIKRKKIISKKRKKFLIEKSLTKNLFGDEKEIIKYLLKRKRRESWTKEIVRDLGINKVRLSRKLRNLQQRGLIEKIPYGNENRIRLIKRK